MPPSTSDPRALIQAAQIQTQANRYAFLRQANNKRIIREVITKATSSTTR